MGSVMMAVASTMNGNHDKNGLARKSKMKSHMQFLLLQPFSLTLLLMIL